jgi:antitoxin ParD1/3/4
MNKYDRSFSVKRKTFSMPDEIADFIETRVRSGQYGNDSEYVRDLVRRDQERLATIARFQRLIDEGIASGVSNATMDDIRREAKRRHAAARKK